MQEKPLVVFIHVSTVKRHKKYEQMSSREKVHGSSQNTRYGCVSASLGETSVAFQSEGKEAGK